MSLVLLLKYVYPCSSGNARGLGNIRIKELDGAAEALGVGFPLS